MGNELADKWGKTEAMAGQWMLEPRIATPADIRQAFSLYTRVPHRKWDRDELRGLMFLYMDRGIDVPDREGRSSLLRLQKNIECGAPTRVGVRGE